MQPISCWGRFRSPKYVCNYYLFEHKAKIAANHKGGGKKKISIDNADVTELV